LRWEISMLDCDPLDCEDPSLDSGGVSAPELEVHVLDLVASR